MLERIEQLGGCLSVISHPGNGTQIEALIPSFDRNRERAKMAKNT